jgi:hypothetical protein
MNSVNPSLRNTFPITQDYNGYKKAPPPSLENRFQISQDYSVCKQVPPPQTVWERIRDGGRPTKYCTEEIIDGIPYGAPILGSCFGRFTDSIIGAPWHERGPLVNTPDSLNKFIKSCLLPLEPLQIQNFWFIDPNDPSRTIHSAPQHKEGTEPR